MHILGTPGHLKCIKVGYPVTSITGLDFSAIRMRKVLIDPSTGLPLVSSTWSVLGDREPDLMFGPQHFL